MKHLFTLTLMCLAMGLNAQLNYPWNPDEDGDSSIGSNDLLGFLTVYGEDFEPEPIIVDSVDLLSVISSLQSQVESLQGQVDSLSTVTSTVQGLSVLQGEDTITSSAHSFRFIGDGMDVTNGDTSNEVVVNIPGNGGSKVYLFKGDYGGSQIVTSSRAVTDISQVTQITSSPYSTSSTIVTIPTVSGQNEIKFQFSSETLPPVGVFLIGWDAATERYKWTQVDSPARDGWNPDNSNILTDFTVTSYTNSNKLIETNLLTSFSSGQFRINLDFDQTGASNGTHPSLFTALYGHVYVMFIFP